MALDEHMVRRWRNSDILLLGGSAGSFKIIFQIARSFTAQLNKTVIIIIHRKPNFFSEIEALFSDSIHIAFKEISDKDQINKNTIYIAPANYHTLIEKEGSFSLDVSDSIWYSKPSIDVTFENAAEVFADRCTAVLFSGANQDGAAGLLNLRNSGALTIAQYPGDAEMPVMPQAAIDINAAEYTLRTIEILELLK
ncbi:MAG TPA: chemotaxis protein CheB [Mucilaginibacter sp.]